MFEAKIPLWTSERDEGNIFWNTDFKKLLLVTLAPTQSCNRDCF